MLFGLAYVASYMLVAMGIFNVILAVYATWNMPATSAFWQGTKSTIFGFVFAGVFFSSQPFTFYTGMVVIDLFEIVITCRSAF